MPQKEKEQVGEKEKQSISNEDIGRKNQFLAGFQKNREQPTRVILFFKHRPNLTMTRQHQ